jgi:hypothetical protein
MRWGPSTGHDVPTEAVYCTDNIPSHFSLLFLSQHSYLSSVGCISESTYLNLICCHKLRKMRKIHPPTHTHKDKDKDKCWQSFEPRNPRPTHTHKARARKHARIYIYSWINLCDDTVTMHCFTILYVCIISYLLLSSTLSPFHPGLSLTSLTCWLCVCYSN